MEIASADLAVLRDLYNRGLYMQAHAAGDRFGPLREWSNPAARLMAGRLAIQLGAPRLGRRLHLLALRLSPAYPEAVYYHARYLLDRHGPLSAWRMMRQHTDWSDAGPEMRADWYGLHAYVAARFRDFDRSEMWLTRAANESAGKPWLAIERSACYELAERYEDALAAARDALAIVPNFRAGVQAVAHVLHLLGRPEEAVQTLAEASPHLESGIVTGQLAAMLLEQRRECEALDALDRYESLSPLLEADGKKWLAARRADALYALGRWGDARRQSLTIDEPFFRTFAAALEPLEAADAPPDAPLAGGKARRVRLELAVDEPPTAIPTASAYLRALAAFWGRSLDKPTLAESPPPDGLPDVLERRWAEGQGFAAAEATLTLDGAAALIDAGIPFLLTSVEAGYPHPQLVVGYDRVRGSVLFAEHGVRAPVEAPVSAIVERYGATGPRLLALCPDKAKLDAARPALADVERYDALHAVQSALARFEREAAHAAFAPLADGSPGHRVTLQAANALARFDAHPVPTRRAVQALADAYPEEPTYRLSLLWALRELGRRDDRLALLRDEVAKADPEPLFAQHYAQSYAGDPERAGEARLALYRAIRKRPYTAGAYYLLGRLEWEQRNFNEATELYRFATALEDRDEQFAEAYFRAARVLGRTPEAVRFLQNRFHRTKVKVSAPGRAFYHALCEQDEPAAALDILRQAIDARPSDAELLLFAADVRGAAEDDRTEAHAHLEAARPHAAPGVWRRAAARLAALDIDLPAGIEHWRAVLKDEPLALDAHAGLARLLSEYEGKPAALAHLRAAVARFPRHYGLCQLLLDWLRGDPGRDNEALVRRMIADVPDDAWSHRELALYLANQKRFDEALKVMESARRLEPDSPLYYFSLGRVLTQADRLDEARETYWAVARQSIDHDMAVNELFGLARSKEAQEELLREVAEELQRQPHRGDSLTLYFEKGVQILEPEDIHPVLVELLETHGHLWQVWSLAARALAMMERLEESSELIGAAIERFPLVPRLRADLGSLCGQREDVDGEIEALQGALRVNPGWSEAARELSELMRNNERVEEARQVLRQAIARAPLDPSNHGYLAELLWDEGESAEALARVARAVRVDPGYDWAWRSHANWSSRLDEPGRHLELAREVTRLRPGDVNAWLALARCLTEPAQSEEALAAMDAAVRLNPRLVEGHDLRAEKLAEMGRFAEAKKAASPEAFAGEDVPMILRGRLAWIEAREGDYPAAVNRMTAILALEPNYYWGWQQLAEWHNESGDAEEYLKAAGELVRLRPDSPMALAMRGEARLKNGEREEAKEDLRDAQKAAPGYPFPGMLLFDAYLADDELTPARRTLAILQEHVGGPLVVGRQVTLAAKMDDKEQALDALAELCGLVAETAWPMQTAVSATREAGWLDETDRVLKDAVDGDGPFHPWAAMLWLEGPAGERADFDTRHAVLRRALDEHPRFIQGHDMAAEMLARAGRYEEALRHCRPVAFGDRTPLSLRGRAAWVAAARGDRDAAVRQMRELLEEDRDYFWGWQQLARWYDQEDAYRDYLEAAENLVRLAPEEAMSYGHRGEAKRGLHDRGGAREDFQRAFGMDPRYSFAGLRLLEEELHADEVDAAERTLAKLEEHASSPFARLARVQVACKRKDVPDAVSALSLLAADPEATAFLVTKAVETIDAAGGAAAVDAALTDLVDRGKARDIVVRAWADRLLPGRLGDVLARLGKLLEAGEPGREALEVVVNWCDGPDKADALAEVIARFGSHLRADTEIWAATGDALTSTRQFARAADWFAGWRERDDAEAWMLSPYAFSLRALGRWADAYAVSDAALDMDEDVSLGDHRTWAGLEDALAGRTEAAALRLAEVDPDSLSPTMSLLLEMARWVVEVREADASERPALFREGRARLEERFAARPFAGDPSVRPTWKRVAARVAADVGGLAALLWRVRQAWGGPR